MTDLDTKRPEFTTAFRGYDRMQVEEYIDRLQRLVGEAESRARAAESELDSSGHEEIGPRVAEIFELAGTEARELRRQAREEAEEMLRNARHDAREIVDTANENAERRAEQDRLAHERRVEEQERDIERLHSQIEQLEGHRADVMRELRRLHQALGAASGFVASDSPTAPLDADGYMAAAELDGTEPTAELEAGHAPIEDDPEFEWEQPTHVSVGSGG